MILCRLIAPKWATDSDSSLPRVLEGLFTDEQIAEYNVQGYNIYYLPNYPSHYQKGVTVDGSQVDVFEYVFVDCDLKDGIFESKDAFLSLVKVVDIPPTQVVDSGNGIHVYWKVDNLDAMSYLRFQRRLMRLYNTDEAVGQLFQLMRLPGSLNTKNRDNFIPCTILQTDGPTYTAEQLDNLLPAITLQDEEYCKEHYDRTHGINQTQTIIDDTLPPKFGKLLHDSPEAKSLWSGSTTDRSKGDYRLAHLMFANGFTKNEALSVLVNSAKALQRAPIHRASYAENIVSKIWTYELAPDKEVLPLSMSVKDILQRSGDTLKGTPFRCHPRIDNTAHGFRLGQVIGMVGGSGIGKTAFTLNMFQWFVQNNPDYIHFFIPLEQPANEIADRWKTMCGADTSLHEKVHIISNYDENGGFRHLSLTEIREYIENFQKTTPFKAGCVVIDHIGALKMGTKDNRENIEDICHQMKAFAVQTNTLLVMQSQTSREKAGIGDLELNKDAAYGTVFFESYVDYLITLWQPLKRCHGEDACPTVTAFKYCKIRHKKARKDVIKEDKPYFLYFDSDTERMRDLTQDEIRSFNYFLPKATNKRKADRKTELVEYTSVPYKEQEVVNVGPVDSDRHSTRH